jgi:soluble lytic murein transglycosylase-like protein
MAELLWDLLAKRQDPGQAFGQSFEQGQIDSALRAYGQNPDSPEGLSALMRADPRVGIQAQQLQRQRQKDDQAESAAAEKQHRELLLTGAKIIRSVKPQDDASWQQVRTLGQQYGIPMDAVPDHYDPNYVQQVVAMADALDPQSSQNLMNVAPGGSVFDPQARKPIYQAPFKPELHNIPEGAIAVPMGGPQPAAAGTPNVDAIWNSLVQQESGGRPGITGPQTPFGRAQGMTQMLPQTAEAMAGKLNLPWQPQMMTDATPEGADYQGKLGRAYFDEGLQKYGGDMEKALMYYHGGPNEAMWGPKTRAYAKSVMARAGQAVGAPSGTPAGIIRNPKAPKPAEPTYKMLSEAEAQQAGLPAGGKYQRAPNGKIETVAGTINQGPTRQQVGLAKAKLGTLRAIEGQIGRVEAAMGAVEKGGWTGAISGHVPGSWDKESNVFDKAVRQYAVLVRQLTRVPGEGSQSDYEAKLNELTLPSRTDTPEGRREALAGIKELVTQIRAGYEDLLGGSASASGAPSSGGWGAATVVK